MPDPFGAFVDDCYRELLRLMADVRDYLESLQETEVGGDAESRSRIIGEISMVTHRLTDAMAWLMLQRAVMAGEITPDQARARGEGMLSLAPPADGDAAASRRLPVEIRSFIDRSRRLYGQVVHLRTTSERALF